ncbi:hypothetical protein B0H17DRAFT_1137093 [Mycena rosella]|uniref:Uncharacterized protein n=1 Tax=Mycena rosella TaxID=1033263 RepID=A0AAD7GFZ3_MYCRO|nr:hypothetical protein B0H17DRAFT_1137093 [Mycena rosella]
MSSAFAVTRPVNLCEAEPAITEEQLWKGLHYQARNAGIVREVGFGYFPDVFTEIFEAHAATIMYCEMDTGKRVMNVVSYGPDDEMFLAYGFANGIPGVAADQPKPSAKDLNGIIGKTLKEAIALVRQMIKERKL